MEGVTYKSSVEYNSSSTVDDKLEIPDACYKPIPSPVHMNLSSSTEEAIVFDLETSSLGKLYMQYSVQYYKLITILRRQYLKILTASWEKIYSVLWRSVFKITVRI